MGDRDESYWSNFNSIKVRLKLLATLLGAGLGLLFQFHKGTIKTRLKDYLDFILMLFQFHKGTIKTSETSNEG